MNYHVVIKTERRVPTPDKPRELALPISSATLNADGTTTASAPQLHTMGSVINDMTNVVYAASWDGISPWIVVTAGKISDLTMAFAGWPMVDQATWEAANPVVTP